MHKRNSQLNKDLMFTFYHVTKNTIRKREFANKVYYMRFILNLVMLSIESVNW